MLIKLALLHYYEPKYCSQVIKALDYKPEGR
jgi:hypothetical protein